MTLFKNQIIVHNKAASIKEVIEASDVDFEIQTRIREGRVKAVNKMKSWWKTMKTNARFLRDRYGVRGYKNYYEYYIKKVYRERIVETVEEELD